MKEKAYSYHSSIKPTDLVTLWRTSFIDAYHDVHSEDDIKKYLDEHYTLSEAERVVNSEAYERIVARRDSNNVGVVIINKTSCPIGKYPKSYELKHLYLLASEYGSGLGKELLFKAMDLLRNKEQNSMWLCVSSRNKRAQKFYLKYGFREIGVGPQLVVGKDIFPSKIMIREL